MRPQTNKDNISEQDGSNPGRVMKTRSASIEKSSIIDKAANVHELTRERNEESNGYDDELSANNLATLLRRLSDGSTREIENLIGELHSLRNKLQSDGNRIQSDITKYSQLSQGVVQLAAIIADNVKKLPAASDIPQSLEK
jgi:hypothetical protein